MQKIALVLTQLMSKEGIREKNEGEWTGKVEIIT